MDNFENNQNANSQTPSGDSKSWGPTIGLVIILALIIVGSLYFFINDESPIGPSANEPSVTDIENELGDFRSLDDSDELASIEADLEKTDLSNLDAELEAAAREIEEI